MDDGTSLPAIPGTTQDIRGAQMTIGDDVLMVIRRCSFLALNFWLSRSKLQIRVCVLWTVMVVLSPIDEAVQWPCAHRHRYEDAGVILTYIVLIAGWIVWCDLFGCLG